MEDRLRAVAAALLRERKVRLTDLQELFRLPRELVLDLLRDVPVSFEGDSVAVTDAAELILACWGKGVDLVDLALKAGWKDFEQLCSKILEKVGFQTVTNVRFKVGGSLRELDVLAFREPKVLAIDCKKWVKRREGSLKSAARAHRERCTQLAKSLVELKEVKPIVSRWKEARLYPVVVDIHETETRIFEGVPIVPLRKLISFVNELDAFEEEVHSISVDLKAVDRLELR